MNERVGPQVFSGSWKMASEAWLADACDQMLLGCKISGKMGNQEAELNFWKQHKNGLLCVLSAQL